MFIDFETLEMYAFAGLCFCYFYSTVEEASFNERVYLHFTCLSSNEKGSSQPLDSSNIKK